MSSQTVPRDASPAGVALSQSVETQTNVPELPQEIHAYVRHNIQIWVQWFTFFVIVNYTALGWFASDITHHKIENRRPLMLVAFFFAFQCILGIWVSLRLRQWFSSADRQNCSPTGKTSASGKQTSAGFYAFAILLGCLALGSIVLLWLVLSIGAQGKS